MSFFVTLLFSLPLDVPLWVAEVTRSHKLLHTKRRRFANQENMIFAHMFPWRADHSIVDALFWTLDQKRMLCKRMTSQPDANQRQTFFSPINCMNNFICERAYWWGFVFKLSTRTLFYECNALYCSSLLRQWTASFDQMIKVNCYICKTYVYWICFIATLLLPHCVQSALCTLG